MTEKKFIEGVEIGLSTVKQLQFLATKLEHFGAPVADLNRQIAGLGPPPVTEDQAINVTWEQKVLAILRVCDALKKRLAKADEKKDIDELLKPFNKVYLMSA